MGPKSFAYTVTGDANNPALQSGDKVVIDPDVVPVPGDWVLAEVPGEADPIILRKYRPRARLPGGGNSYELQPGNQDWGSIQIDTPEQAKIIGTMVEHRRYRRDPQI